MRQLATALVVAALVLGAGAWSSTGTRNLKKDDVSLREADGGPGGSRAPGQRRSWRPGGSRPISIQQPEAEPAPTRPTLGDGGGTGSWVGGGFVLPGGGYERPVAQMCACPSGDMPSDDGEMVDCSGHGICNTTWCGTRRGAVCECDDGWLGHACGYEATRIGDAVDDFNRLVNATWRIEEQMQQGRERCPDREKPVWCRQKSECRETPLDCFSEPVGHVGHDGQGALQEWEDSEQRKCGRDERFCFVNGCVPKFSRILCSPISSTCPEHKPFRCRNWKCAVNHTACSSGEKPDGFVCPNGKAVDTARQCLRNMTWDGCPAGKIDCPQKRGLCVDSLDECERKTGCPVGNVSCGFLRGPNGRPVVSVDPETGERALKHDCRESCQKGRGLGDSKPVATSGVLGRGKNKIDVHAEDGRLALAIEMRGENAFKRVDGGDADVTFNVRPVPDSHKQEGSFKKFHDRGTLLNVITVEPSVPLDLDQAEGGLELQFPVPDDAAVGSDESRCLRLVSGMQVLSVPDISQVDAEAEFVDFCKPQLLWQDTDQEAQCACAINVSHFTTFATVDAGADDEVAGSWIELPCYTEAGQLYSDDSIFGTQSGPCYDSNKKLYTCSDCSACSDCTQSQWVESSLDVLGDHLRMTWNSPIYDESQGLCDETRTWPQIDTSDKSKFATGGLGKIMWEDKVEVWACFAEHKCLEFLQTYVQDLYPESADVIKLDDHMCYVYDEENLTWLPWAPNSLLELVSANTTSPQPPSFTGDKCPVWLNFAKNKCPEWIGGTGCQDPTAAEGAAICTEWSKDNYNNDCYKSTDEAGISSSWAGCLR